MKYSQLVVLFFTPPNIPSNDLEVKFYYQPKFILLYNQYIESWYFHM